MRDRIATFGFYRRLFAGKCIPSILTLCMLGACQERKTDIEFSSADAAEIKKLLQEYREGWLSNDTIKIMSIISDSALMIPSGMMPVSTKPNIREFWWPDDGSKTTIDEYEILLLEISGENGLAYTIEHGKLSWHYQKQDISFAKRQESNEITIWKREAEHWKMIRRIWTDLNH